MNYKYDLSIIITLYNRRELCVRALKSSLIQNIRNKLNVEIIVVDDGSTDEPLFILGPFIDEECVRYFFKENGGPASAKNHGAQKARGKFILFLDSDDYLNGEDALDELIDLLKLKPDLVAAKSILIKKVSGDSMKFYEAPDDQYDNCLQYPLNYVGMPPYVFNRKAFLLAGGLNENHKWGDALSFWRVFIKDARVLYMNRPSYVYDQSHDVSVSRSKGKGFYSKVLKTISESYEISKNEIDSKGYSFNWGVIILVLSAATLNRKLFFNWFFRCLLAPVKTVKSIIYVFKKRREKE